MKTPPPEKLDQHEIEARLIYSIIVAGKSADFADNATKQFLYCLKKATGSRKGTTPFKMLRKLNVAVIEACARAARTGNYAKISKACYELANTKLHLMQVTPATLEMIHGIGPKTSRFFIMWVRPHERYAALDVHILRWMRACGVETPVATPQHPAIYAELEEKFISMADELGKTPRQLDMEIWEAGAGRTQRTALPGGQP